MKLTKNHKFQDRAEIGDLLGGDLQKGIATTNRINAILLFMNEEELYKDYFYPRGKYDFCMYTGIGKRGNQDSVENPVYDLNIAVLTHKKRNVSLLLFEKREGQYYFVGKYQLIETHQNIQPDENNEMRRVFVFHLEKISDTFELHG